jgi:hypothetical protein
MDVRKRVPAVELGISIAGTEPAIWRQLVLPETVTIAELHGAIQKAFGWKDYHLYGVRALDRKGRPRIIIGGDGDPDELDGEPADGVKLLELIDPTRPGMAVEYEYDFGDTWTHVIEVVGPAKIGENTIVCLDGAMRGPVEDCGGVGGYANLVRVLKNPKHPEHGETAEWFEATTGEKASDFDPSAFDVVETNGQLRRLCRRLWPGDTTPDDVESVLAPMLWLLREAVADGLELTPAGYLKPGTVNRAMTELGWDAGWTGGPSRNERNIPPILNLRNLLQEWKLLRKLKDRLVLTPAGRRVAATPALLWDYVADRLASPEDPADLVMTELLLHWAVRGTPPPAEQRSQFIRDALYQAGLRADDGGEIPLEWVLALDREISQPLRCLMLNGSPEWMHSRQDELSDGGLRFLLDVQRRMREREG